MARPSGTSHAMLLWVCFCGIGTIVPQMTLNVTLCCCTHLKPRVCKPAPTHCNVPRFVLYALVTKWINKINRYIPYVRSSLDRRTFSVIGPRLWNSLPPDTRNSSSLPIFRSSLKPHLFKIAFPSLGSLPSPVTVYPDFDSCYSHFMPYRMTPTIA